MITCPTRFGVLISNQHDIAQDCSFAENTRDESLYRGFANTATTP